MKIRLDLPHTKSRRAPPKLRVFRAQIDFVRKMTERKEHLKTHETLEMFSYVIEKLSPAVFWSYESWGICALNRECESSLKIHRQSNCRQIKGSPGGLDKVF